MKTKKDILFGMRPVMEALQAGKDIDKVLLQKGLQGDQARVLLQLLRDHNIPFQFVPPPKLNRITGKNHQGVIAFVSPISFTRIDSIVPVIFENGKTPLILILDQVTDVRNFGAIVRTAECAGANAIVIAKKGAAQINSDAVKTSAGALFNLPVCREDSLAKVVQYLQESGITVVACTEKTQELHFTLDLTLPTAIIMGSEETGISNELLKKSDYLAKIPMSGKIASLNVSVAAGIMLFEAVRQRAIE